MNIAPLLISLPCTVHFVYSTATVYGIPMNSGSNGSNSVPTTSTDVSKLDTNEFNYWILLLSVPTIANGGMKFSIVGIDIKYNYKMLLAYNILEVLASTFSITLSTGNDNTNATYFLILSFSAWFR